MSAQTSSILHLDFETRSTLDLKKVGLHRYADPRFTDILCGAFAFDDEPVDWWSKYQKLYTDKQLIPDRVAYHITSGGKIHAHNSTFEFEIWNQIIAGGALGCAMISEQMHCTMTMAFAMGLPGALENAAPALGIEQRKDAEGKRLMIQMSKPKDIDPVTGAVTWWDDEERMQRLIKYCMQDVIVEREIGKKMFDLSPYERKVWLMDQKINSRGITVDRIAAIAAVKLVEKQENKLDEQMRVISNGEIATCTAVQQIKDHLQFYGVAEESLSKSDVSGLLDKINLDPHARAVLSLRAQAGKAATKKLNPMIDRTSDENPRLRGAFQYSGANTRRWAGRGVQLHNLKRPSLKQPVIEMILKNIAEGVSADEIDLCFGSPLSIIGDCTRGFFTASPGNRLITCDFSAIEARVLAWLAGQDNVLDIFRRDKDIYLIQASAIFGIPIKELQDWHRQVGKVAVLALGYQGGVGAFQQMAKGYGVKMEPAFKELWNNSDISIQERALDRYKSAGGKYEISKEEFLASEITKIKWRLANPKIVDHWAAVENAFISAIKYPGQTFTIGNANRAVKFKKNGSFLWCQLPSGGVICYPYPELKETKTPWDTIKILPSYMSEDGQSHKWQRFSTYGGSADENITQATARDLLADAMLRLEENNYPIVAHVHDECICDLPENVGSLEEMKRIMENSPQWAFDLPIKAGGWTGFRYRK